MKKYFGWLIVLASLFITFDVLADETKKVNVDSYDLRTNYQVGLVKNQNESNACWAYAATSALESNLLSNHFGQNVYSPAHILVMTQNTYPIVSHKTYNRPLAKGGNSSIAATYMMNHWGPVSESSYPITNIGSDSIVADTATKIKPELDIKDVAFLSSAQGKCSESMLDAIKYHLVTYGALVANVYYESYTDNDFIKDGYYYYDGKEYTDNVGETIEANKTPNHEVVIIGFDDNIEVSNYNNLTVPSRKGAFIVQNSYGTSNGNNGYLYISYDDINICTDLVGYYNLSTKVPDNAYYYDYLGQNAETTFTNDIYIANKFTKKTDGNEHLDRVTFYNIAPNTEYKVYYSATGDLTSKALIFGGTTDHIGYISVKPNTEITLTDNFAIIVEFINTGDIKVALAMNDERETSIYHGYDIKDNTSYSSADGVNWVVMKNSEDLLAQNTIRLYSSNTDVAIPGPVETKAEVVEDKEEKPKTNNPDTGYFLNITIISLVAIISVILIIVANRFNKLKNRI